MKMPSLPLKIIISIITTFIFIPLNLLSDDVCFTVNEKFEKRRVRVSVDPPASGDIQYINVPDGVGFNQKYNIKGAWGWNYNYNRGTWSVTAGWVDDESSESADFWTMGKFNTKFFDERDIENVSSGRKFDLIFEIPNDEEAVKHSFLKLQIYYSATGDNKMFYETWIYKIPITDKIYGKVLTADVNFDTKTIDMSPIENVYTGILYGSDILSDTLSDSNGCFSLVQPNDPVKVFELRVMDGVTTGKELFTRNIQDVAEGSKNTCIIPRGIYEKYQAEYDKLNKVTLKQDILWDNFPVEFTLLPYFIPQQRDFFSKCRLYSGTSTDIMSGNENDSVRADFLSRLVLIDKAAHPVYYQYHNINGELMKAIYATVMGVLFVKEIYGIADKVVAAVSNGTSAKLAAEMMWKYGLGLTNSILGYSIDRIPNKFIKGKMKLAVQAVTANAAEFQGKTKSGLIWDAFWKEGFGNLVLVTGNILVMPAYVLYSEGIIDEPAKIANETYPDSPLNVKGELSVAIDSVIGPLGFVAQGEEFSKTCKETSRDKRNGSKILDALSAIAVMGGNLITMGAIAAPEVAIPILLGIVVVLQGIKFVNLLHALLICIGGMSQYAYLLDDITKTSMGEYQRTVTYDEPYDYSDDVIMKKIMLKGNETLGANHPAMLASADLNEVTATYLTQMNELITDLDNTDEFIQRMNNMMTTETDIYDKCEESRNTLLTSFDYVKHEQKDYIDRIGNYFDLTHQSNSYRMLLNMKLFEYKMAPSQVIKDSILLLADSVAYYLGAMRDTTASLSQTSSGYPSRGYVVVSKKTEFVDTLNNNVQYEMKATVKNVGGSDADSVRVSIETDKFRIDSQNEFLIEKLTAGEEAEFTWLFTVTDTSLFVCDYNFNIEAATGMTSAITYNYFRVRGSIVNEVIAGETTGKRLELNIGPNPSEDFTLVQFTLPFDAQVRIGIYDALGNFVKPVFEGYQFADFYNYSLSTSELPSGVYYLKADGKDFSITKILSVVK